MEVRDLPLWNPIDDAGVESLAARWSECGVLVFRRQSLGEEELLAFSRRLGELDIIVRRDWQSPRHREITHISNLKDAAGRSIGGLGAGAIDWHSDQSYMRKPATGSLLYMVEGPAASGRTTWAHLGRAYAALPAARRREIEGLHVVYDYRKRQATYDDEAPMSDALRRATPAVSHPLVNRHPVTGRSSLYLDPATACGVRERPAAEGERLLGDLVRHATQRRFLYEHTWQVGDVVLWDNGIVMHRREPIDPRSPRLLKRTTFHLSPTRHIVPPGVEVEPAPVASQSTR